MQLFSEIDDKDHLNDYVKLINHFQRHTIHSKYCYQSTSKEKICRFKFPKPLIEKSTLKLNPSSNQFEFLSERNDQLMNPHSRFITEIWRANHDLQNIVSVHAVLTYVAKYTSKSENKSDDLNSFIKILLNNDNVYSDFKVSTIINKILMKNLVQRDYSAQETCYFLMGYKFYQSSKQFLTIDLSSNDDQYVFTNMFPNSSNNNQRLTDPASKTITSRKRNYLDEYVNRPDKYQEWNLTKYFSKTYKFKGDIVERKRGKDIVLQFKPYINPNDKEATCKREIMLSFPFRDINILFNESWENTLRVLKNQDNQFLESNLDIESELQQIQEDLEDESDFEIDPFIETNEIQHQFFQMSRTGTNPQIINKLGFRDKDLLEYDWTKHCKTVAEIRSHYDFLNSIKEFNNSEVIEENVNINLNDEQQKVIDLFNQQLSDVLNNNESEVKRVIVQGKAGSGKSTIIKKITASLFKSKLGPERFLLLAPTGIAALNINGSTIHSKLRTFGPDQLQNEQLQNFQKEFEKVKFIIIDEYSMVGAKLMNRINGRLEQAKSYDKEPFGGLFI